MAFVLMYARRHGLVTETGLSDIEKECIEQAKGARMEYKQTLDEMDGIEPGTRRSRNISTEEKHLIRLRNNRHSGSALKVFQEVLLRAMSARLLQIDNEVVEGTESRKAYINPSLSNGTETHLEDSAINNNVPILPKWGEPKLHLRRHLARLNGIGMVGNLETSPEQQSVTPEPARTKTARLPLHHPASSSFCQVEMWGTIRAQVQNSTVIESRGMEAGTSRTTPGKGSFLPRRAIKGPEVSTPFTLEQTGVMRQNVNEKAD